MSEKSKEKYSEINSRNDFMLAYLALCTGGRTKREGVVFHISWSQVFVLNERRTKRGERTKRGSTVHTFSYPNLLFAILGDFFCDRFYPHQVVIG